MKFNQTQGIMVDGPRAYIERGDIFKIGMRTKLRKLMDEHLTKINNHSPVKSKPF